MKYFSTLYCLGLSFMLLSSASAVSQRQPIKARHDITLNQAHKGDQKIDSLLLESYMPTSDSIKKFYLEARAIFEKDTAAFTDDRIIVAAKRNHINLISGPMLGNVQAERVTLWLRPANTNILQIKVNSQEGTDIKTHELKPIRPGKVERIVLDGLKPTTHYDYHISTNDRVISQGSFRTAPKSGENSTVRITFASGFHKIGLHNPNLIRSIINRKPLAMLLLGDLAVDDRDTHWGLHRSDYLLRDVSPAWQELASKIPLYASWDDHDYLNNDLSGIPEGVTKADRDSLRSIWQNNWNNPTAIGDGIYFNTRIGEVEIIMLDTRSCRNLDERGDYGSYLGTSQLQWLKEVLKNSTAPFKVISSGTMWSDYVTKAKDSWGTWDVAARKEIYSLIESEGISGVLLISGDRHGARAFTIPRPSGLNFYEFEVASMGGVPGPPAMAEDSSHQLFGYEGLGLKAFGEFTFTTSSKQPEVTFRLIDESGSIIEEYFLEYDALLPLKK